MKLQTYLSRFKTTTEALAASLACSYETVRRYQKDGRIPEKNLMKKIYSVTQGKVTPNDFYDLPPISKKTGNGQ